MGLPCVGETRALLACLERAADLPYESRFFPVAQAEQFQSALFSILLDHSLEHSETKELPMSDGSWYLLLPLKHDKSLDLSQDQEIDWDRIAKLKSFGDSKDVISMTENACPKADGATLRFSNGVINIEDVPGLLVETIHNKQLYWIIDMFTDLKADSPFPNKQYRSYTDYFEIKHGCKLELRGQHLLKAKDLRRAYNFLLARSREEDHDSRDAANNFTEADRSAQLPPEVCSIKYFGLYEDLVNAAVILPSLLHKLESILLATQLHRYFSSQLPKESVVSVKKVLEALTTQKCLDYFSLERLELLGDSFLKYAISYHLFLVHEEADEGFLTSQRTQKICNASLFTLGSKLGLAVLGDIVESLSAAICVDSGFDLSLTWKVFEPILQPLNLCGNVRLHPVRELYEVCQKNGFTCSPSPEGGRQCQHKFEIHVNNEVVIGAATAKNKDSGRRQAALDALAKLKVLGYVHPASVKL